MQGREGDVPGPVTVCCTNTGKFVGAEGQQGPRNWVCPVESSIPTYLSTDAFHTSVFLLPQPTTWRALGGEVHPTLVQHYLQTTPQPWFRPSLVCRELEVTL